MCRNPFNTNRETLHIFIEKENVLGNALDKEFACHEDSENAVPAGDAFSFAELHYKQQGDELLQTINKELFLRIGEEKGFYTNRCKSLVCPQIPKISCNPFSPLFSFFKAPISNTKTDIETITAYIEAAAVDIAPNYADWHDLGFALADALGESGRNYYHRLSLFYSGYAENETDKQFDKCLKAHGHGVTIKTLYHLAKQAGVEIAILPKWQNEKSGKTESNTTTKST